MTSAIDYLAPDALAIQSPDDCYWAATGWEDAGECSVQSAEGRTRAQAAEAFRFDPGVAFTDVRVWKRYIRPFTRQDQWEEYLIGHVGCVRRDDGTFVEAVPRVGESADEFPAEPPRDWSAHEGVACWEFVHRSTPGAWPVWVCGFRGDEPPTNPPAATPRGTDA
jgi:hypothetical protein